MGITVSCAPSTAAEWISPGEAAFLWWFIQGSIMNPQVRERLYAACGLCPRHGLTWLIVEAGLRQGYLHGPALFYADLMRRAQASFELDGPFRAWRLARRLRPRGPCHLCDLGFGPDSRGSIPAARLRRARDPTCLHTLMDESHAFWESTVCGRCAGSADQARCRPHLCEELRRGEPADLIGQAALVTRITQHIDRYQRSFRWESHGTDTAEDRGALIAACGWSGGWEALLAFSHVAH